MDTRTATARLCLGATTVAEYVIETGLEPQHSPRPYLHPVRTLGGTTVTDLLPADHRWHLGASLAVQDVAGTNLWGGRTYVRDRGYTWLPDHGTMTHLSWMERSEQRLAHRLAWLDPRDNVLLAEERVIAARPLSHGRRSNGREAWAPTAGPAASSTTADGSDGNGRPETDSGWLLDISYTLTAPADRDIPLGSPATNGRPGGSGYGGFFWRLCPYPTDVPPRVFTRGTEGEEQANGSTEPWLAMVGTDRAGAAYTLIFIGLAPGDQWFVRARMYPGVCVAFAFEHPRVIPAGQRHTGQHTVAIIDGALSTAEVTAIAEAQLG